MKPTDILHRAKRIDRPNELAYGYYRYRKDYYNDGSNQERHIIYTDQHESICEQIIDPSTLCVYTTLTDSNGKKVFSGDVLYKKWINGDGREEEVSHLIVFYDGAFCVEKYLVQRFNGKRMEYPSRITQHWVDECQFEIIGNIQDNKELIVKI